MDHDEDITDDCRALRLVRAEWIKPNGRPSSAAFQDRRESGAMSVYLEGDILRAGRSVEELLERWEGYTPFYLTVGELRNDFKQTVERDPRDDFPGHALVRDMNGKRSQKTKSRMALLVRRYE